MNQVAALSMIFNEQDRSDGVTLSASFGSGSRGTEMLRGVYPRAQRRAQHDIPNVGGYIS